MAIPYKKLFGLCSVLPRWGKHGLALCLVTSMPSLQDGRKAGVWFLLQTYRPDGTRGKEAGMVFFGKHGGPSGRWICSGGAVGLYKTLSLMKLVRRRCSMFWGWLPTTQTPPAPALKTALVFTNISSRWDGKGLSECFLD